MSDSSLALRSQAQPSELAPTSSALLAELLPQYLDPEAYAVVLGAVDETTALLEKQWGHIVFTGSGRVGKIVAGAAAKTLTPTTLELGGKSPTIVAADANMRLTARRMMSIKPISNSQICVSPDYILVVREKLDEFVSAIQETLTQFYPPAPHPRSALTNPTTGALQSDAAYKRQTAFLDKAEQAGHTVIRGETDAANRRMGISLVIMKNGVKEGDQIMNPTEEIFGPVLPIIPVDSIDEAIAFINARPHPLALYVCSHSRATFNKVINETISGHATWNDFSMVPIGRSVPFGGVGDSGWGSYHGWEGFQTFSHEKAILEVPFYLEPLLNIRYGRTSPFVQKIIRFAMCAPVPYARPASVEDEKWKRQIGTWRDGLLWCVVVLAFGFGVGSYLNWTLPRVFVL